MEAKEHLRYLNWKSHSRINLYFTEDIETEHRNIRRQEHEHYITRKHKEKTQYQISIGKHTFVNKFIEEMLYLTG